MLKIRMLPGNVCRSLYGCSISPKGSFDFWQIESEDGIAFRVQAITSRSQFFLLGGIREIPGGDMVWYFMGRGVYLSGPEIDIIYRALNKILKISRVYWHTYEIFFAVHKINWL